MKHNISIIRFTPPTLSPHLNTLSICASSSASVKKMRLNFHGLNTRSRHVAMLSVAKAIAAAVTDSGHVCGAEGGGKVAAGFRVWRGLRRIR